MAVRYGGEALGVPGLALRGLLDAAPLRRTLERRIDWQQLHANVANGAVSAIAVTTTEITTGRSITFVERASGGAPQPAGGWDHRDARLGADHVMASAAIPALFPPVWIATPADVAGWYVDGSTRLH
ncbi:MAG: patatin-like phospholipase family protein, partial [Actinobacteria bacterium]|nr:patatin-like phospholipase family protein [Actinomycetota bacterium]